MAKRNLGWGFAALAFPVSAWAQTSTAPVQAVPQNGQVAVVSILCPSGVGDQATLAVCNFGSGGGGGVVSQGAQAASASGNTWWVQFASAQPISATALPLPAGAATSANQVVPTAAGTGGANAASIQGIAGGVAVPVSAATLPLPTGAATAANQTAVFAAQAATTFPADYMGIAFPTLASGNGGAAVAGQWFPPAVTLSQSERVSEYAPGSGNSAVDSNGAGTPGGAHINSGCVYNSGGTTLTAAQGAVTPCNTQSAPYMDAEGLKASYSISGAITLAATPTDVQCLPGSASKTIRLRRLRIYTSATTAGTMTMALIKRSSANIGGTSAAATVVPNDSTNAAGSAVPLTYTANPGTLGTPVGAVDTAIIDFGLTASGPVYDAQFGTVGEQSIVLRSTGQEVCINFGGGTVPTGPAFSYKETYIEE